MLSPSWVVRTRRVSWAKASLPKSYTLVSAAGRVALSGFCLVFTKG